MMEKQDKSYNLVIFMIFIVLIFGVFFARYYELAIMKQSNGVNLSDTSPIFDRGSSVVRKQRGSIYDRSGKPIAIDTTSYSIYAVISEDAQEEAIKDADYTAQRLAKHLPIEQDQLLEYLITPNTQQVEFGPRGQNLSQDVMEAIQKEKLPGIYFLPANKRHYINDYFASHLVGYTQANEEGNLVGQMGIEKAYDEVLSPVDTPNNQGEVSRGNDLFLTLDSRLQNQLEALIEESYQTYQAEEMGAYLVEVQTGKLLAATQRPSFNLNTLDGIEDEWRLLLVENAYEPGSTIKILTLAAAREMGVVQLSDRFMSGSVTIYDQVVSDYNVSGWGEITFGDGLIRSSNVAMVELVDRMGLDKWLKELKRFGFGQVTRSRLANEAEGSITFDNPVSETMSAFGQALLTSPIQLLQAYSAIGNEGKMMQVQYIDRIEGRDEQVYQPEVIKELFDPSITQEILDLMVEATTSPDGTARDFKHDAFPVAAKTGTAQIAAPEGGYLTGPSDYYFSVISFFPADQPEYMLYLTMKRPQKAEGITGSQILSRIFHPFVDYVLINP